MDILQYERGLELKVWGEEALDSVDCTLCMYYSLDTIVHGKQHGDPTKAAASLAWEIQWR